MGISQCYLTRKEENSHRQQLQTIHEIPIDDGLLNVLGCESSGLIPGKGISQAQLIEIEIVVRDSFGSVEWERCHLKRVQWAGGDDGVLG